MGPNIYSQGIWKTRVDAFKKNVYFLPSKNYGGLTDLQESRACFTRFFS